MLKLALLALVTVALATALGAPAYLLRRAGVGGRRAVAVEMLLRIAIGSLLLTVVVLAVGRPGP